MPTNASFREFFTCTQWHFMNGICMYVYVYNKLWWHTCFREFMPVDTPWHTHTHTKANKYQFSSPFSLSFSIQVIAPIESTQVNMCYSLCIFDMHKIFQKEKSYESTRSIPTISLYCVHNSIWTLNWIDIFYTNTEILFEFNSMKYLLKY